MRSASYLIISLFLVTPLGLASALPGAPTATPAVPMAEPEYHSMWELAEMYGDTFPLEPAPEGLTQQERIRYWLHDRDVQGMTVTGRLDDLQARYLKTPASAPAPTDLTAAMHTLYAALGVTLTPAQDAVLEAEGAGLDPQLAAAFGGVVAHTAEAYAEQAERADRILARWADGFDVHTTLVTVEERDAMTDLQTDLLAMLDGFAARFDEFTPTKVPVADDEPLFKDPLGLVVLGGVGDTPHAPNAGPLRDPVLTFDPSGDDTYTHSAGGACPDLLDVAHECNQLALSIVYDLDGADTYSHSGVPYAVQGAGSIGGVGMLVDVAGNDTYMADFTRPCRGPFFQYIDAGAQGFAQGGSGALVDRAGDDVYRIDVASSCNRSIWGFGQGYGSAGSLGVAIDAEGDDQWLGFGNGGSNTFNSFQGLYPQGSGFYGGVGVVADLGAGDDRYHTFLRSRTTDYYAQGFGAFGGLGIQYEDGGHDTYYAVEDAYDPWIVPLLNCAFGTASIGGVGIFIDVWGNDSYHGDTISPYAAATMNEGFGGIGAAYGLHLDLEGDDDRVMLASGGPGSSVAGRGYALQHGNIIGDYLDAGGLDRYVGPGQNDAVWLGGADQDITPGGLF